MRLSNITVDEVSLVDKAANKRKFAFLKRDPKVIAQELEISQAQTIINKQDEPTAEEKAELDKLFNEFNELTALVNKQ